MIERTIPFVDVSLTEMEKEAVLEVLESKRLIEGKFSREFENKFKKFAGVKHAITCANGTAALHLAMEAVGLRPGDEVLTTPFTFIATSNSILFVGAVPKFVDVKSDTWNLDPEKVEEAITEKTKAIMPVHIFGLPADMKAFRDLADDRNLILIEDAAQAHGARIDGVHAGNFGDIATFSLYATKNLISGEGGVVVTNNEELAEKVESLKNHGRTLEGGYKHVRVGFNYRMTDLQGAIASVQMDRLPDLLERRSKNAAHFRKIIDEIDGIDYQHIPKGFTHADYIFAIDTRNSSVKPKEAVERFKAENVMARPIYATLSYQQENFKNIYEWRWSQCVKYPDYSKTHCPISEQIGPNHFEIPIVPSLSEEERIHVGETIRKVFS